MEELLVHSFHYSKQDDRCQSILWYLIPTTINNKHWIKSKYFVLQGPLLVSKKAINGAIVPWSADNLSEKTIQVETILFSSGDSSSEENKKSKQLYSQLQGVCLERQLSYLVREQRSMSIMHPYLYGRFFRKLCVTACWLLIVEAGLWIRVLYITVCRQKNKKHSMRGKFSGLLPKNERISIFGNLICQ